MAFHQVFFKPKMIFIWEKNSSNKDLFLNKELKVSRNIISFDRFTKAISVENFHFEDEFLKIGRGHSLDSYR